MNLLSAMNLSPTINPWKACERIPLAPTCIPVTQLYHATHRKCAEQIHTQEPPFLPITAPPTSHKGRCPYCSQWPP